MWLTGKQDLRIALSDGPTDRYHFRKRVFGELNGSNLRFKTFEFRRITDFTLSPGVFLNGVLLPVSSVSTDSILTGEFILTTPPIDGDVLEASYYTQWFLDAELDDFLVDSSRWCLSIDDFTQTPPGLISATKSYACSRAYLKMSQRWRDYVSSVYKVEDAPKDPASGPVSDFIKMAKTFREEAEAQRKEFYKRQDQPLQPLFGIVRGNVRSMP
jgi:hypothetical protein